MVTPVSILFAAGLVMHPGMTIEKCWRHAHAAEKRGVSRASTEAFVTKCIAFVVLENKCPSSKDREWYAESKD